MENAHHNEFQKQVMFVRKWLQSLNIPEEQAQFETNDQSISLLYKLAKTHEARDKENILLKQDYQTKMKEYQVEIGRLQSIWMDFSNNQMPLQLSGYAQTLSELAVALDLKQTKTSDFLLSMNDLQDELNKVEEERKQMNEQSKQMNRQTLLAANRLKQLQK